MSYQHQFRVETGHRQPYGRVGRGQIRHVEPLQPAGPSNGPIPKVRCRHELSGTSPKVIKITIARERHFHPNGVTCNACTHRPQCAATG